MRVLVGGETAAGIDASSYLGHRLPLVIAEAASLVKKAQEGRRLVPQKTYRNFRFNPPVVEPTTVISGDGDGDSHALAGRASSAPEPIISGRFYRAASAVTVVSRVA